MKRILTLFVALAFVLGAAQAQTLTVGQGEPVTLDPHGQNDQPSARVRVQIYETLVEQTPDLDLVPWLAESWEQVDDLTWHFHIREGVTFHNGDPLTAHDVVYSFERLRSPEQASPSAFIVGFLDTIEAIDDMTVEMTTKYIFAPLLAHLSHNATSIVNQRVVEEAGPDFGTTVVVGTGAFRFVSWETGSQLVIERNPDWWNGQAGVERVVFRPIPDSTVLSIELETGGVDVAYDVNPQDISRLEDHPSVELLEYQDLGTTYVGFNADRAPFDDVRVRQAINHAIDIETIVDVIWEGQAVRAASPLSPNVFASHPGVEPYAYDPERARQLLADAGYPDGFETSIWTNDNPLRIQVAEIAQAQLGEIGVTVDIRVLEWGTYLAETAAGNHDMFILGWSTVTADADYGLYALFHSSEIGASNRTYWSDARVDELLDRGRQTVDPDDRTAIYYEAQEIIAEEAPWIFVAFQTRHTGVRAHVENFQNQPNGTHRLYMVSRN
ncbi:ABC transporter substrate-binding protein [soil metagenome]